MGLAQLNVYTSKWEKPAQNTRTCTRLRAWTLHGEQYCILHQTSRDRLRCLYHTAYLPARLLLDLWHLAPRATAPPQSRKARTTSRLPLPSLPSRTGALHKTPSPQQSSARQCAVIALRKPRPSARHPPPNNHDRLSRIAQTTSTAATTRTRTAPRWNTKTPNPRPSAQGLPPRAKRRHPRALQPGLKMLRMLWNPLLSRRRLEERRSVRLLLNHRALSQRHNKTQSRWRMCRIRLKSPRSPKS